MQCPALTRAPQTAITCFDDLVLFLEPDHEPSSHPLDRPPFPALQHAIHGYQDHFHADFYTTLWPRILEWAWTVPGTYAPTGLSFTSPQVSSCGTYTSAKCNYDTDVARYILANMFVLNKPQPAPECGNLDLYRLMNSQARCREEDVGAARLECLLAYFHTIAEEEQGRTITIERRQWLGQAHELDASGHTLAGVNLMETSMESAADATRFVNFANQDLHIHRIIPSGTQEEVLFSCAPEAFVAIGLCPRMTSDQVIMIRNVRRFVEYTGYLSSFKFLRLVGTRRVFDILSIDAVTRSHYTVASVDRDVRKATLAMLPTDEKHGRGGVVTGHWGCGVFGGNKTHKFIQQWVAASRANVPMLHYSVFGDVQLMNFLRQVEAAIRAREWTIDDVATRLLSNYSAMCAAADKAKADGYIWTLLSTMSTPSRKVSYEEFIATEFGLEAVGCSNLLLW
ncbi:hypothetical protein H257_10235 [Aphanomyces astaci]|uniref:PARG catalytic Macro domain-containing protein n=1 Tax=Aphanomyces astaci TaxID=112090 RepID=W4G8U7_APHAT|nr:hypothetical protein H257_10235 [Aphanomyces astaci]ETV75383.1 hypothetical protein H257_10235 [Aphanomyces astaci]|eukprot:XP_009835017.1 hypothetical protein H257_10235 [Aphanomyces astaci]